ncbi:hypothetical protein [Brevibacillus sp. SYSU BS000544]|uniref:hypothetical protein n=1 Tax=Brevibacillus sp. SYSU BS000544 TaxID=3416443 RepID=UPI003CE47835
MAQRLSTNYANAYFTMSERELNQFVQLFVEENITVQVKVCDNGDRDIVMADRNGDIELPFRRQGSRYLCESSYVITDLGLANVMRKAMKAFKGHGVVHRVYDGFTVVYHYDEGSVTRIEEVTEEAGVPIFEADVEVNQRTKELEEMFSKMGSEQEIQHIREEVDRLLDLRNWVNRSYPEKLGSVDEKLVTFSKRLFVLEA